MALYFPPKGNLNKKAKIKKLNNVPSYFETDFYKNWLENNDLSIDSNFQKKLGLETPSKDDKIYPLTTSEYGKQIQEDFGLYTTRNSLNKSSFRRMLDPIAKNDIRKQNPIK